MFAALLCPAMTLAIVSGCHSARAVRTARLQPARIRAIELRVDAISGQTLLIPVVLEGAIDPAKPVRGRLDDGRTVSAPLYWVSVTLPQDGPDWSSWLDPAGAWTVTPASASTRPSANGWWVVAIDLPLDAIGQGVWLNDDRIALNWMGEPHAAAQAPIAWRAEDESSRSAALLKLVEPEARSPVRRWRYRLLTLGPQGIAWGMEGERPPGLASEAEGAFKEPVLEAMARQSEARWSAALSWLWLADADLAERVRRRLVATVDFGNGTVAPMWPTTMQELDALRDELLNPRHDAATRAERATDWLDSLPPAAAWVADDAGLRGPGARPLATFGVANITERSTLTWANATGSADAPELTAVPSLRVQSVAAAAPEAESKPRLAPHSGPAAFEVHAGRWMGERPALVEALPVAPPGLRMAPFVGDWTMGALLAGAPDRTMAIGPAWAGAGMLQTRADSAEAGEHGPWWLYLECKSPPGRAGSPPPGEETVRIWLGPPGHAFSILRISSIGAVVDERAIEQTGDGAVRGATVSREPDRWVCQVPIPMGVIEEDGTIRIAMERVDALGRRSAWPRPMMPWQTEPGRVRVDTRAWGAMEAAGR